MSVFFIIAAIIIAGIIALCVYDFLVGHRTPLDLVKECRIARSDIKALDERCATNPDRSSIIVSLTSIPSRLPLIADTLKSLLDQTRAPAEIRLYLPKVSQRENRPYPIPRWLAELACVRVIRCEEDHGPATKFLPALQSLPPDQMLVVVDDDRIFQSRMIELFDRHALADREAAFGFGGWVVPPDLIDRKTTFRMALFNTPPAQIRSARVRGPAPMDILMGAHAFLVRPRFFDLQRLADFRDTPPAVRFADDIWISAHCLVPKFVLPLSPGDFQPRRHLPSYIRSSIGRLNRNGPPEAWLNTIALKYFGPEPWKVGCPAPGQEGPPSSSS